MVEMPRYCAVKVCRNRGGSSAAKQENKRISFYPFPLQDNSRLQKWVDNMKRDEWAPSRHQYLCSEHFTEDCFNVRWGIRYLKNTAIPTIFPSVRDEGETKNQRPNKPELSTTHSPPNKRPLIHLTPEPRSTACEVQGDSRTSCLGLGSPCQGEELLPQEMADAAVSVLCCESLGPHSGVEVRFVPTEPVEEQGEAVDCMAADQGPVEGEHVSVYEHSYCRADTDGEQLWSKILNLHGKILELDHREETTVAKIHALESEIVRLKKDGAVFKEKQKLLEDCISSILL